MRDIIYLLLYCLIESLNVGMIYTIILGAELTRKKHRYVLAVFLFFLFHTAVFVKLGYRDATGMTVFTTALFPMLLIEKEKKKYLFLYVFVKVFPSVIAISSTFIAAVVLHVPERVILDTALYASVCQCAPVFFLSGVWLYRKRKKTNILPYLDSKQCILFTTAAVCCFFMLAPMQVLAARKELGWEITVAGTAVSAASLILLGVTVLQGIVVSREIRLKARTELLEKYMQMQKEYFLQTVLQDKEMRKFRHDINAHLAMLQSYCERGEFSQLSRYVSRIAKETAKTKTECYTGNPGIDAVLRPTLQEAERKGIEVETESALPAGLPIEEFDLCIILSNLIKNAAEACEKQPVGQCRKIWIFFGAYYNRLYLRVKNTIAGPVGEEGNRLATTKKDKNRHGFGSENVRRAVEKYSGELTYDSTEKEFTVEIII